MSKALLLIIILSYLGLLFLIANRAERLKKLHKYILPPSLTYALSLAVFCTAWTFFGSIGNAAKSGLSFLPVYLGPTLFMPVLAIILSKLVRICGSMRITSIADFISSRYGKNISLGVIVSLFCIIGIVPYIAIQLKAIGEGVNLITQYSDNQHILTDTTFYISIGLAVFIILYGIGNIDTSEQHTGVITAIAFESIVKIVAFLAVGVFVSFYLFESPMALFQEAFQSQAFQKHFTLNENTSPISWILISLISAIAIILLPRQFQVGVVENTNQNHIQKAIWIFPLYLFLINIFVLPLAIGGVLRFGNNTNLDLLLLQFPSHQGADVLTLIAFIGGFSAATGMVIMETIALTTMISNNVAIPLLLSFHRTKAAPSSISKIILYSRRIGAVLLILLSYIFENYVAKNYSLVSIGLISFVAVAQFAPSVFFGLFWKEANRKAALTSICIGFAIWFYTLVLPSLSNGHDSIQAIRDQGLFGLLFLKPYALFGLSHLDSISHGVFWSLLFNLFSFVLVSILTKRDAVEIHQANAFVDFDGVNLPSSNSIWKGTTLLQDIRQVLTNFIGEERTHALLEGYANRHSIRLDYSKQADSRIVHFAERILGGVIGAASSRLMISSVTKDENIQITEIIDIVKESQQFIELNKELRKKSLELEKASQELNTANSQLKRMDELKNEFLYTVTHELRTPLTSIRALTEILYDNPDMEEEQKQEYLDIIIREIEKLSHLITQVLNLEKYESGRQKVYPVSFDLPLLIDEVVASLKPLMEKKKIAFYKIIPNSTILIHADKDLIRQVIYNLISNAIKFAESSIEIHLLPGEQDIEVKLRDDGKGIDMQNRELLFDKFYQSKQNQLQKPEGSGLGLAICKRIVDLHGGKIFAENNKEKGACFTFVLPLIH